jgi:hypothetical protein
VVRGRFESLGGDTWSVGKETKTLAGLHTPSPPGRTCLHHVVPVSVDCLQLEINEILKCIVPLGACLNLSLNLAIASSSTLMSCADPGHPASTNVKKHIEVTCSHDILCCLVLATHVMLQLILWNDHRNVGAIYCPYAFREFRGESELLQPWMNCAKRWVPRCNDVIS